MTVSRFLKVQGMTRPASRARKLKFIDSFGDKTFGHLVKSMLAIEGEAFFTDEQIAVMTEYLVKDARVSQHLNMRNRSRSSVRFQQAAE